MLSSRGTELQEGLVSALKRELEIAKKFSSGDRTNAVKDGVRTIVKEDSFLYEFEELSGFPPDEGVEVVFTVGEKTSNGRFLGEVNSKFLFELSEDLGEKIPLAKIVSDPLFLISRQISFLTSDSPFESEIALASLGLATSKPVERLSLDQNFMKGLNPLQADSLRVVATKPVTYIWGPPGTGKTLTMGSVVAALASMGQKVLLVSNTNLAIDTALERCMDRYSDVANIGDGVMLRLGTAVKPELIKKYGNKVDLDVIFLKEVAPLNKEISRISGILAKQKNSVSDNQESERKYQLHLNKTQGPDKARKKLIELREDAKKFKNNIPQIKNKISELETELNAASSKSGIGRLFSGKRNPGAINIDLDSEKSKQVQAKKALTRISGEMKEVEEEISEIEKQSASSTAWLAKNPNAKDLKNIINAEQIEIVKNETLIVEIQKQIAEKRAEILERARVIACTAFKPLLDKDVAAMKFDSVVIDEASMLPLPLYFCAASLAKSRIVVAGDFRQLPPIVRVGSQGAVPGSAEDLIDKSHRALMVENPFTKADVLGKFRRGEITDELIALRDQYRMREPISDLISTTFYPEHTLRTVAEKTDKPTPWGNESFILFDTTSLSPESSQVNGKSRRNLIHAIIVKAISEKLMEDGWELKATAKKSFGIITPYNKQSAIIEQLISSGSSEYIKGGISTVHRFQGNERDLMIIDLTKVSSNSEPGLGNFLGNPSALAPENALWNVAISRARQHVIVIADLPTLERNKSALISHLISKMKPNLKIIEAKTIIDTELLSRVGASPKSDKGSISWYTGESFYKAFSKDLVGAKSKVLLASPFTTNDGTERWMQTFRDLKARDVEIVGLTKPLSEKDNSDASEPLHKNLSSVFKELRDVPRMHEKLAVIDQKIVWLGSLNILSHRNASEIMVRIDSPDFAQSLIDEYQNGRFNKARGPKLTPEEMKKKIGKKCEVPGCNGQSELRPAGYSSAKRKAYDAFLGCTNWKEHNDLLSRH